jgi:hypothetical protein
VSSMCWFRMQQLLVNPSSPPAFPSVAGFAPSLLVHSRQWYHGSIMLYSQLNPPAAAPPPTSCSGTCWPASASASWWCLRP